MSDETRLAAAIRVLVRTFLVANRYGAPGEGRLRFNPLDFHVLNALRDGGDARPTALAEALGVAKTTLGSALARLEAGGLTERRADPDDSRARLACLTPEGRAVVAAIRRQDARNASAMLDALPPEDRDAFLAAMARIARTLGEPR